MSVIPALDPSIQNDLAQLHDSFSSSSILVKTIRNAATSHAQAASNTFNSGYVKNINTIIDVYDKLLESVGLYRSQRGITTFTITTSPVAANSIAGTQNQINAMVNELQNQLTTLSTLMSNCIANTDSSALKYCNLVTSIITQLNYLIAIMNSQLSNAGGGSGIMTFSELFADNSGISYLDQLQLYPKI